MIKFKLNNQEIGSQAQVAHVQAALQGASPGKYRDQVQY